MGIIKQIPSEASNISGSSLFITYLKLYKFYNDTLGRNILFQMHINNQNGMLRHSLEGAVICISLPHVGQNKVLLRNKWVLGVILIKKKTFFFVFFQTFFLDFRHDITEKGLKEQKRLKMAPKKFNDQLLIVPSTRKQVEKHKTPIRSVTT